MERTVANDANSRYCEGRKKNATTANASFPSIWDYISRAAIITVRLGDLEPG